MSEIAEAGETRSGHQAALITPWSATEVDLAAVAQIMQRASQRLETLQQSAPMLLRRARPASR